MDVARRADWIVDVGPAAGEHGGEVLYSGPVEGLAEVERSITRRYLFPDDDRREARTPREPEAWLELRHVTRHNLQDLEASFPLGRADRGDRRVGLRQVDPGDPGAGRRASAPRRRSAEDEEEPDAERGR